ncbi:helix-turn-helix domain-containing protein [Blastococcus saxobsidens]|uniref:helix-turn-helix domain-containing protein n=1 Tax=Blastococcus saxobsidens TaxID=138336 RepID=UPI0020129627|nr:helix-turn-helix domain-containing protein [Blastococcus saxobsidens]
MLSRYGKDHVLLTPRTLGASLRTGREKSLGALLRQVRGDRSPAEVAATSGVGLEVLRTIESGRVPTPTFFTLAALAHALGLPLDELAEQLGGLADRAGAHRLGQAAGSAVSTVVKCSTTGNGS